VDWKNEKENEKGKFDESRGTPDLDRGSLGIGRWGLVIAR
jgi:hypothetical protein